MYIPLLCTKEKEVRSNIANVQVWMGEIKGPEYYRTHYSVDAVFYTDEMAQCLAALDAPQLHVLSGVNSDRWLSICISQNCHALVIPVRVKSHQNAYFS